MIQISDLLVNDYVQARNTSTDGQVLVTEFTVASVSGIRVYGSDHYPDGLSTGDGWEFELIDREQTYPTSLAMIDAHFGDGTVTRLMGMGDLWTTIDSGVRIPVSSIVYFDLVVT